MCVIDTVGHTLRRENKRVRYVVGGGKRYQGKKKKKKKKKYVDKREREEGDDYIPPVLCFFFGYTHLVGIRNVELHRVKKKKSIFFFFSRMCSFHLPRWRKSPRTCVMLRNPKDRIKLNEYQGKKKREREKERTK